MKICCVGDNYHSCNRNHVGDNSSIVVLIIKLTINIRSKNFFDVDNRLPHFWNCGTIKMGQFLAHRCILIFLSRAFVSRDNSFWSKSWTSFFFNISWCVFLKILEMNFLKILILINTTKMNFWILWLARTTSPTDPKIPEKDDFRLNLK